MATTKAKTIKVSDFASAIEKAVKASGVKKFPGGIIMGKVAPKGLAAKDATALARDITKQVQGLTDAKLTPKVINDGGIITVGFIAIPPVEINR